MTGRRRAFVTMDAVAAVAVMVLLLAFVGQWSGSVMQYRRSIEHRRRARQAVDNVAALAMACDYDTLTVDWLTSRAKDYLPRRAEWDIQVQSPIVGHDGTDVPAKRVTLELLYRDRPLDKRRPLLIFRYPSQRDAVHD